MIKLENLNHRKTMEISEEQWQVLLQVATEYGWKAQGTQVPKFADYSSIPWDGIYFPAHGQQVIAPDAKSLANTLKLASEKLDADESDLAQRVANFSEQGSFLISQS